MIVLRTLGAIEVRRSAGGMLALAHQPKALALLAYLAVHDGHVARDTLLALFWPDLDDPRARHALRQLLLRVRSNVGPRALPCHRSMMVRLDPRHVWCDARDCLLALEEGRSADALSLYRGEFLAGFHLPGCAAFESWLDAMRRDLRRGAANASWALMEEAWREGRWPEARRLAERGLGLAPYEEGWWRRYLELLALSGEAAAAREAYRLLVARLRDDLEQEPAAATVEVARRLLR